MKVLIPGISGSIGRLVARRLAAAGHEVVGIDRRPWPYAPAGIEVHQVDIRKRAAEDIFRKVRPHTVIHLATVTHLMERSEERYRINLGGTRAVFDHCSNYGVKQMIFVGRHTYYGAAPDSPLYHLEQEPPRAIARFPELADLVAADLYAGQALWRMPALDTAVLRICYTLGPSGQGTLARFLRGPRVPRVVGFDPLFQFMHEEDEARAICAALHHGVRGVYNVAGPPPVPLSVIIDKAGRRPLAMPKFAWMLLLGRLGLPGLSEGALDHIKYPVLMDTLAFQKVTGFQHEYDEEQTLREYRETFAV
jgi:UDP-glucose 4-epimerase